METFAFSTIVSKSVLISLYPPGGSILERFQELDIIAFIGMSKNFTGLTTIIKKPGKSPSL